MKICFLTNELSPSHGWGRYSIGLIKALVDKGWECLVLLDKRAKIASDATKDDDLAGIEKYKILTSSRNDWLKLLFIGRDYLRARKIVRDCQLLHSLIEPYAPLAARLAKEKPFFITVHGTYAISFFDQPSVGCLFRESLKRAKRVFCVSHFTQREILAKINLANTQVIQNGVEYERWQTKEKFAPRKEKIILGVGALKARKGYHIALEAVAKVKKRYPDLKYYIVGEQSDKHYYEKLQELVKKHHLQNNVKFLANISDKDLVRLYYQADLFLLTPVNIDQKFEGFGLVYLEANACAKPVIGTFGCGAEDAIRDGYNGLLVPQNDVAETAKVALKILDNPALGQELGRHGRQHAKDNDWSKVAEQYLQAYKSFLQ